MYVCVCVCVDLCARVHVITLSLDFPSFSGRRRRPSAVIAQKPNERNADEPRAQRKSSSAAVKETRRVRRINNKIDVNANAVYKGKKIHTETNDVKPSSFTLHENRVFDISDSPKGTVPKFVEFSIVFSFLKLLKSTSLIHLF